MKLAHLADLHLGFRQFDRLTPRGTNQREADVADAFRRAVDDLLEQQPDLILIAGDVFHSVRPTNAAILFFFQQLQRVHAALPETPIVMWTRPAGSRSPSSTARCWRCRTRRWRSPNGRRCGPSAAPRPTSCCCTAKSKA